MTLKDKIAAQREAKAEACERRAAKHDHFGPSAWGVTYRAEAAFWRDAAATARSGDLRPVNPVWQASRTAEHVDAAFSRAIEEAFGPKVSRWEVDVATAPEAVRAAYDAKVSADRASNAAFAASRGEGAAHA